MGVSTSNEELTSVSPNSKRDVITTFSPTGPTNLRVLAKTLSLTE